MNSVDFILFLFLLTLEDVCVNHQPTCFLCSAAGGAGLLSSSDETEREEFLLPECGLLFEARRIQKVRNRDVWESLVCQHALRQ